MMTITYFFSMNSPWTYMGSARFHRMAKQYHAQVAVKPAPFAQVLAATGGVPQPQRSPQRRAYRLMELRRWSAHLGLPMNVEPKFYPTDDRPPSHLVIAAELQGRDALLLSSEIGRAQWELDQNIAEPDVLEAAAERAGLDYGQIMRAAPEGSELDTIWQANAKEAIERGVFGAPAYVLADGEWFWGQDRLDFLERALAARAKG